MDKRKIFFTFLLLAAAVILLALATRIWLKANGLDQHVGYTQSVQSDPPRDRHTIGDLTGDHGITGIQEENTQFDSDGQVLYLYTCPSVYFHFSVERGQDIPQIDFNPDAAG